MHCPKGKIERKAHSRKGSKRRIKKTCVPDKGKPGKTPEAEKVLPKPGKEISLSKYGYSTKDTMRDRQKALMTASKANSELQVLRRLNLLRNYQADEISKQKMSRDVEFMKKAYSQYKIKNN